MDMNSISNALRFLSPLVAGRDHIDEFASRSFKHRALRHFHRALAHLELLVSLFIVFLFIAAVALITGIGGPGQTVGDMFYSTWLAFWVSLGISIQSFKQLNTAEGVGDSSEQQKSKNPSQKIPFARGHTVLV